MPGIDVHNVPPPDADSDYFSFSEFDSIRLRITSGLSSLVNFTSPQKRGYANNVIDNTDDGSLSSRFQLAEGSKFGDNNSVKSDITNMSFDNPTFQPKSS